MASKSVEAVSQSLNFLVDFLRTLVLWLLCYAFWLYHVTLGIGSIRSTEEKVKLKSGKVKSGERGRKGS